MTWCKGTQHKAARHGARRAQAAPSGEHGSRVADPIMQELRGTRPGAGDLSRLPQVLHELFGEADEEVVAFRADQWRCWSAQACGLAPDVAAERRLVGSMADFAGHMRVCMQWPAALGMLLRRSAALGLSVPHELPGTDERGLCNAFEKTRPRPLLETTATGASRLAAAIAAAEGIDESPATVAAWATADLVDNLDVWAAGVQGALGDQRPDLAVCLLAAIILAFDPCSPAVTTELPSALAAATRCRPRGAAVGLAAGVEGTPWGADAPADLAALAAAPSAPDALAAAVGWVRTAHAAAGYLVDTAIAVATARGQEPATTMGSVLAHWGLLTEYVA